MHWHKSSGSILAEVGHVRMVSFVRVQEKQDGKKMEEIFILWLREWKLAQSFSTQEVEMMTDSNGQALANLLFLVNTTTLGCQSMQCNQAYNGARKFWRSSTRVWNGNSIFVKLQSLTQSRQFLRTVKKCKEQKPRYADCLCFCAVNCIKGMLQCFVCRKESLMTTGFAVAHASSASVPCHKTEWAWSNWP